MAVLSIRRFLPRITKYPKVQHYSTSGVLRIPRHVYNDMKAHMLEVAPRECCGLLSTWGSNAVRSYRITNIAEEPNDGYRMDVDDQYNIIETIEDQELEVGAIYHSHPRARPFPSLTDIRLAYPGLLQIIMGMDNGLVTKAFEISNGNIREIKLEII